MQKLNLGITANELFACNPYRILGTAVDTPQADISQLYKKLLAMSESGEVEGYHTKFDFPSSLPPFTRTAKDLKTAYAKIASNGYRCFAYASEEFSAALNIDDVMLNLRDITCYDCFLRCYMWLITNDRKLEEPELWILLCKHIDKMIMSSENEWETYFDHRFPASMLDSGLAAYRAFYSTFCDIILLPIKELVRGSMKCTSAMDILAAAKIDINEEFEYVEIPQANIARNGEKAPLLKIAVKDGEEYFDVSKGIMVNFETDAEAAESNDFTVAESAISADAIAGEDIVEEIPHEEEKSVIETTKTQKPVEEVKPVETIPEPQPVQNKPPKPVPKPVQVHKEVAVQKAEKEEKNSSTEEIIIPARRKKAVIPHKDSDSAVSSKKIETVAYNQPAVQISFSAQENGDTTDVPATETPKIKTKSPYKKQSKSLSAMVDSIEDETVSDDEESENMYTDALIAMLRSNRSKNQMMKDVDTKHVFDNGDSLGIADSESDIIMDEINMKKLDKSLLETPYNADTIKTDDPKKMLAQKYKNININDMLNPTLGTKYNNGYREDAIDAFKRQKEKQRKSKMLMLKIMGFMALLVIIFLILIYFGVL